jgi:hypothetical protein
MTILPPAVLTTTQLVGGLVASAKNALDIAKASSDHKLKAALNELNDSVFDVQRRVLDLDEENRRLKSELSRQAEVVGPVPPHGYFFLKEKPENPLCPTCWQSQPRNQRFLSPIEHNSSGSWRKCTAQGCTYMRWEARPSFRQEQNGKLNYWE